GATGRRIVVQVNYGPVAYRRINRGCRRKIHDDSSVAERVNPLLYLATSLGVFDCLYAVLAGVLENDIFTTDYRLQVARFMERMRTNEELNVTKVAILNPLGHEFRSRFFMEKVRGTKSVQNVR